MLAVVGLVEVEVFDPRAGVAQRIWNRAFLDVHVIHVRLHAEVVEPEFIDVVDRLVDRRQHAGRPSYVFSGSSRM